MIQIKVTNKKIDTVYFGNKKLDGWIEVQSIPEAEQRDGYIPVMYYRDGQIVYEYESIPEEPQEEVSIEELKKQKIEELNTYYNTEGTNGLNEFFINDMSMWLDPELRGNIDRQVSSNILLGNPTTDLSVNGTVLNIPNDTARLMLAKLELYAGQCYNVRDSKEKEINELTTKEEIEAYDVTTGYPEKLKFEL